MPSAKAAAAAAASLGRLYGSQVVVRHYNVFDPAVQREHAATLAHIDEERWPLPVTLLNGAVLFVGGLQPLKLVAAVAEQLQKLSGSAESDR
jgi:hypothetical protein